MGAVDYRKQWNAAYAWADYLGAGVKEHRNLWTAVWERAKVPEWALEQAARLGGEWRLLVISEDWCGDASNTVPVLARLADVVPGLELRVLRRDEHAEVMDRYLTNGSRSIPVVIVLDEEFAELGHWGPRPSELQSWVMTNRLTVPKSELYPQVRRWYARDRGESTLREVLAAAGFPVAKVA
jgi:hypothetical protein